MKFLLVAINAKYIHSNPAVYSLCKYATQQVPELEETIEIAEYTINNSMDSILSDLYKLRPDVIGISCYIWNWNMVKDIVREIKKLLPDIIIWLGGPEVTYNPENVFSEVPDADGIMIGEGEGTFLDIMKMYSGIDAGPINAIRGICYRKGGKILRTEPREQLNLTELPFLYNNPEDFNNRIIYYESSRGCPFRCSYCLSSIDKTVRLRDTEVVKRELQHFLDNKVTQVKFVDRTFNCNHNHAMEIWKYISEHDTGITNFHFEIEADLLTDEEIELLNILRPGAVQMEIGVQSTNDATLKEIRRYASVDKIRESVAKLQRGQNIHIHLDLIAGLPYETLDIFKKSFNDVFTMKPEQLQLGFLKVLKGSHMYDMAKEYGLVYKSLPPYEVLYTKWLSYEDVIILKKVEEMVEIYYNSNQYRHVLPVLLSKFPDAFTMFYELAKFYDRKGYCINTPSRSGKYEALLDFADEVCMGEHDIFTELMTFDLYAREKMKSRSGFMNDITKQYEVIRTFFEDEENIVKYLPDYARYHSKQIMKMTHAEIFHYSVWDEQVREVEPTLVVFDYKIRNPLTGEIKFFLISL